MQYYKEIRWHGRGGHGIVSTSNILCEMAVLKGYYAQSIPVFGAERRGAPTRASTRISDKPIYRRSEVKEPDIVVVTDSTLFNIVDPLNGLKGDGVVIVNVDNVDKLGEDVRSKYRVIPVNAIDISLKVGLTVGGIPVVTIPLLGALIKVLGIIDLDTAIRVLRSKWEGGLAEKNIKALEMALEVVEA